jgi:hypothetical protein
MRTVQTIPFVNEVNEKEAQAVFHVLSSSIIFDSSTNTKDDLNDISTMVSFFSRALEKIMQSHLVKSKSDRLKVIKFIDKLKQQTNAIELAKGKKVDLQIAAERLGRKAQSSFSSANSRKN